MLKSLLYLSVACTLMGCATFHRSAEVVERTSHDTLYVNKLHYDSIYIDNWHFAYQKADTVYLETSKREYQYKILRDTIYRVKTDTIPIVREVEVTRDVSRIPLWAKVLACVGVVFLGVKVLRCEGVKM